MTILEVIVYSLVAVVAGVGSVVIADLLLEIWDRLK